MTAGRTGAVVVTYNSADDVEGCLAALLADGVDEVVVIDNASTDDTVDRVGTGSDRQRVSIIRNPSNVGFAAAVNQGLAAVTDVDRVALVNPDTIAAPGTLTALGAVLDARPDVAIVGPRVVNSDGTLYPSVRRFPDVITALGHAVLLFVAPRNRWSRRYKMADWAHDHAAEVDWTAFTFVLARRSALADVGGLDERYFMYVEDVDCCWRLRQRGWVIAYEPAAQVLHHIGGSSASAPYAMIVHHHRSLWEFARRSTTGPARLALPFLAVGLAARVLAAWLQHLVVRRPHAAVSGQP